MSKERYSGEMNVISQIHTMKAEHHMACRNACFGKDQLVRGFYHEMMSIYHEDRAGE